jgi:diaminopimelate epimerase
VLFTKMHGLGNDFIVMEDFTLRLTALGDLSRRLCHRNFGIGADGLVLLQPSDCADFKMRIFNADGSEAEMCGNALRCTARYLYERGFTHNAEIALEVYYTVKTARLQLEDGAVAAVEVNMGEPVLDSSLIPVSGSARRVLEEELDAAGRKFSVTAVSMGNPHCVVFLDDLTGIPLEHWGQAIENHPMFPAKTNVEFVQITTRGEARVIVWERGVGPTLACGSGACAVLVAGVLTGRLDTLAKVHLPGGTLAVEWRQDNHVTMTGPAGEVFRGELATDKAFEDTFMKRG